MRRPSTLFRRSALILGTAFLLFQLTALALVVWLMLLPIARRAADDLAGFMVLSAQTWAELPPYTRPDFEQELVERHSLRVEQAHQLLTVTAPFFPLKPLIEQAVSERIGAPAELRQDPVRPGWYWVEIPLVGRQMRMGFPVGHYDLAAPLVATLIVALGGLLTLLLALWLTRRVARELRALSVAAAAVGRGEVSELPAAGPLELIEFIGNFNRMAREVQALLEGRTTLLAGISHDLRTPLARLRLAVEMLPRTGDARFFELIEASIEEMNGLIGAYLELARGLQREAPVPVDLAVLLRELAAEADLTGEQVTVQVPAATVVPAGRRALKRILSNLLQNALRYSEGKPVTLVGEPCDGETLIRILDQGPGIEPARIEALFRPFQRLEIQRSPTTAGGVGLGLAIARQLAEVNGWRIELLPRPVGGLEARVILREGG